MSRPGTDGRSGSIEEALVRISSVIAGFGASAKVHTDRILRLSLDLPIVVEVVDTEERIQGLMPKLNGMIGGGLITLERAHVVVYRPANASDAGQGGG